MNIKSLGKIAGGQDGAIQNGYLFRFDARGTCNVYYIKNCLNGTSTVGPAIACFTLDKADIIMPHSNSVTFGNEYYCKEDEFPLLYSNIYNNYAASDDKMKGVTCVYRIRKNGTDFSTELVQLIEIGFVEDNLWKSETIKDVRPFGNFAIDRENSVYYTFTMRDEDNCTRYFAFDLPKLNDGEYNEKFGVNRVILNTANIKNQFNCEYHRYVQGACYHNGLIYSLEGFTSDTKNPAAIRIIDIQNKVQKEMYLLSNFNMTIEPEMIDFETDICYYCDNHSNLYQLEFQQKTGSTEILK